MYFNVTFKWYDTDTYCSNIARAETADDVAAHYGSKYSWYSISPATENDVNDAKRRGKPIIKCGPAPAPSDTANDSTPADAEPAETAPAESMKGSDDDSTTAAPVAGPTAVYTDDSTNDDSTPATADAAPAEAIPAAPVDITPAALRGKFCLPHRVTVYVPSTVDAVAGAGAAKIRENQEKTAETLSKLFGGATETHSRGYWISDEYGLIREDVSTVYANCTADQLETHAAAVIRLCEFLRDDMRQECISLEIDGKLYFI